MLAVPKLESFSEHGEFDASLLLNDDSGDFEKTVPKEEWDLPVTDTPIYNIQSSSSSLTLPELLKREQHPDNEQQMFYDAIAMPAMLGKHDVLYYRTYCPSDLCYSFQWKRNTKKGHQAYVCSNCKLKGQNLKINVMNSKFLADPATLPHVCEPLYWPTEAAKRRFFDTTKKLRDSNTSDDAKPAMLFRRIVDEIMNDDSLNYEEKVAQVEAMGPFEKHRRALSRAVNAPARMNTIAKKKREVEQTKEQVAEGLIAVQRLLETVRDIRDIFQEPPLKRQRLEE